MNSFIRVALVVIAALLTAPFIEAAPEGGTEKTEEKSPLTVREAFTSLQCPALEILSRSTRLDMLDYLDADSTYKATNGMEGLSWIANSSPDYLKVQVSPVSTLQLKVLPFKKDKVLMTIYTVGDDPQAADSEVKFYDSSLQEIDARKLFKAPDLSDFFDIPKGSATKMKEIREMVPFPTVAYDVAPDGNGVTARLTVEKYMNIDDYNIIRLFLRPAVDMRWADGYKVAK